MPDFELVETASLTCEACGSVLEARKCKMMCSRCGYFRSCSDLF
ncbi:MAG: hypothetical protein WC759_03385 [Candidatus Micrarchaeia archaeon]